ncbi:uncharacterized protein NDAI_0D01550 [Naumovozyma dairenensis CBS 421]|uniref:Dolichol phosphate-mannose biosynthesis regulatory protein n=1 Tax=Naumovozyma dairenensis (strain ATCC 10597 / BCRC 20456 / CBS 421 / NBRC 0211 / NRRL Y-12639) TaxID=1071378 RepID=G0W9K8_NAUDC|nr:hypothetical protein NDAI_0D01550 [Naumovozyma dairenensis CBS 421]CCD24469.1 hypothetical protein NDAI_0D01550 [Naumovozyma dairenensis CBS 421]
MNRFALILVIAAFYTLWLFLPIFGWDGKIPFFPIPSDYAIYLPIFLLMTGFTLIGTFLGFLLILN